MFTGIIESLGKVISLKNEGTNLHLTVESNISNELKIDQSIAHNGVCLTVVALNENQHEVVAIKETLDKTNLGKLKVGDLVNLERCLKYEGRLDGHVVQGHVDTTGTITLLKDENGSKVYEIHHKNFTEFYTIDKGSVTINGVSLTCFDSTETSFKVAIIPYTFEHTTFHQLNDGDSVNLEFDILGKYVQTHMKRIAAN